MILSLLFLIQNLWSQSWVLPVGGTKTLTTNPNQSIVIEKKGVIKVHDMNHSVQITGHKDGTVLLHLGRQQHKFHILSPQRYQSYQALQNWIKNKRGPELLWDSHHLILQGRLLRCQDFEDFPVQQISEDFTFINRMSVEKNSEECINSYVTQKLNLHQLEDGHLQRTSYWKLILNQKLEKKKKSYQEILNPWGIQIQFHPDTPRLQPMIRMKLFILHATHSFMRDWGVQWPSQFTAKVAPHAPISAEEFHLQLNALESTGQGQLLATPELVGESGAKVEFHSGGEFPIRTNTQFNNSLQWKPYGLFLTITPVLLAKEQLRFEIKLNLSSLDKSLMVDDVPALLQHNLKTVIETKKLGPIVLSGFLQKDQSEGRSGLPWLQQIPIFAPLFSSGKIHEANSEIFFVLYPEIEPL